MGKLKKPLAFDLYCGLGGWTEGLLEQGYDVIGVDIERHDYGDGARYPAQLVLQDVLTIHGRQLRDGALIVASPPCQEFSYMAMPWSKAKAKRQAYLDGSLDRAKLTALFDACFRIQREAIEAAGHFIPLIVENVRGANEWVGRSRWNFGSFHLWGDVPALMPVAFNVAKVPGFRFDGNGGSFQSASVEHTGIKAPGMDWSNPDKRGQDFTRLAGKHAGTKNTGGSWFAIGGPGQKVTGKNPVTRGDGIKQHGSGPVWFDTGIASLPSASKARKARKAASAAIAKIPFPLSQHIARYWKPQ